MTDFTHGRCDRDELAKVICDACEDDASVVPYDVRAADAVIVAGWRKKPSRGDMVSLTAELFIDKTGPLVMADAILALLDGPTETGDSE